MYAELVCSTNFSFLTGASHPEELVAQARALGYAALAITDECSLAGVVKAYAACKEQPGSLKLIIGARFWLEAEGGAAGVTDHGDAATPMAGAGSNNHSDNHRAKINSAGSRDALLQPREKLGLVLLATDRAAYAELSALITLGRRRCEKGQYRLAIADVCERIHRCLGILTPADITAGFETQARALLAPFHGRLWLGLSLTQQDDDYARFRRYHACAQRLGLPLVAQGDVLMHTPARKPLLDVLTAIRLGTTVYSLGHAAQKNAERCLRPLGLLQHVYPPELLAETLKVAARCHFDMGELRYEYPAEIIPAAWRAARTRKKKENASAEARAATDPDGTGAAANDNDTSATVSREWASTHGDCPQEEEHIAGAPVAPEVAGQNPSAAADAASSSGATTAPGSAPLPAHDVLATGESEDSASRRENSSDDASEYLAELTWAGARRRWPDGIDVSIRRQIDAELTLIRELRYEHFFLTVHDIVVFARSRGILCQGRGSAANSAVCFCLGITEVDPARSQLLFERFLSKERNEPPDIDVDFEHERREEVIQYIYGKYGRDRAALAATVISYRGRSALRDVGKALGLDEALIDHLAKNMAWWDKREDLVQRLEEAGIGMASTVAQHLVARLQEIRGFPRHLSQHVGGFVIASRAVSDLVPVENAAMAERSVIQWDKDDLESLGLLKVDVLALGMLTAIRKTFALIAQTGGPRLTMAALPPDDPAVYAMLCRADSVGVFQVESRAQMSMLPRLKPRAFYDLVVQVAIVRPGPVQGGMVHPYLARRAGREPIAYPNEEVKQVLARTYGVPIFQEQVIKMAMVAAGFTGGEADQLRRAMASWKLSGKLAPFEQKLKSGMTARGYSAEYADRLWSQIQGFGEYGFPESHAASFALLVYVSAWLKCHYPAEFCCGLLNSLPMGFYSPSQLIQDVARHGIDVRPLRVEHSHWDHTLEPLAEDGAGRPSADHDTVMCAPASAPASVAAPGRAGSAVGQPRRRFALRLGLRLASGFNAGAAARIISARAQSPFRNLQDLKARAALSKLELEALIAADALAELSGHRPQSQWEAAALAPTAPLLSDLEQRESMHLHDGVARPRPSLVSEVLQDYDSTGLTLKAHPMALLRAQAPFTRCKRAVDLPRLRHGQFLRIAGVVTGRQRPGTASGIIFVTLEDETGNSNVVVKVDVQERCRQALLGSHIALVKGIVENREGVVHVVAGDIEDVSDALGGLAPGSRDFH